MKDASACFGKKIRIKKQNKTTLQPGPVLPPSGEGSPLRLICNVKSDPADTFRKIGPTH